MAECRQVSVHRHVLSADVSEALSKRTPKWVPLLYNHSLALPFLAVSLLGHQKVQHPWSGLIDIMRSVYCAQSLWFGCGSEGYPEGVAAKVMIHIN